MSLLEEVVARFAELTATGQQAKELYISFKDLQQLIEERPDVAVSGTFYGLKIILIVEGAPFFVAPQCCAA